MITISLDGIDAVLDSVRSLPTSIDRRPVFEEVSQKFSARLRAATPRGYSGKLRDSVVYSVTDESAEVGYEEGVETSGDPSLDSVLKPRTLGRSVLKRWAKAEDLESILSGTLDAYEAEAIEFMEKRLARAVS